MMKSKKVSDLVAGDTTEWYQVISVAMKNGKVVAQVRFNDGGTGERVWDDVNTLIEVKS